MKDAEDEAFDELASKQGDWGSGFQAKRAAAMDKINADFDEEYIKYRDAFPKGYKAPQPAQEPVALYVSKTAFGSWREFASDYERGFIDGMQKQAQSSVDKAVNQMAQTAQEPDLTAVYMSGLYDGKKKKRPWVGLTDEECNRMGMSVGDKVVAMWANRILKEKNT